MYVRIVRATAVQLAFNSTQLNQTNKTIMSTLYITLHYYQALSINFMLFCILYSLWLIFKYIKCTDSNQISHRVSSERGLVLEHEYCTLNSKLYAANSVIIPHTPIDANWKLPFMHKPSNNNTSCNSTFAIRHNDKN